MGHTKLFKVLCQGGTESYEPKIKGVSPLSFEEKKVLIKLHEAQQKALKEEAKYQPEVTKKDWVEPNFYWASNRGLINVKNMDSNHIRNAMGSLMERKQNFSVRTWLGIFSNELDRRN